MGVKNFSGHFKKMIYYLQNRGKQYIKKIIDKFDDDFIDLDKNEKLDIFSIEDLAVKSIDEYKEFIHHHIEDLLQKAVDENKVIIKKNRNGKIMDIISVTKEKKNQSLF